MRQHDGIGHEEGDAEHNNRRAQYRRPQVRDETSLYAMPCPFLHFSLVGLLPQMSLCCSETRRCFGNASRTRGRTCELASTSAPSASPSAPRLISSFSTCTTSTTRSSWRPSPPTRGSATPLSSGRCLAVVAAAAAAYTGYSGGCPRSRLPSGA